MTEEQYIKTQHKILAVGRASQGLDIQGFLRKIQQAHTMGPFMDPTLYREALDNIQAIEELAKAVSKVQEASDKLFQAVLGTQMRREGLNETSHRN